MYGQREEIQTNPRLVFTDDGAQDPGVAIGRHDGAIGLTGDLAALQNECAAAPLDLFSELLKHLLSYLFKHLLYLPLPTAGAGAAAAGGGAIRPAAGAVADRLVCVPARDRRDGVLWGRYR